MGVPLEIALIRRHCGRHRGGAEQYCAYLCRELVLMGHRVILIGETCDEGLKGLAEFVPLEPEGLGSAARNLSFHRAAQKALARYPAAVSYALSRTWPVDAFRVTDPLHAHTLGLRYRSPIKRLWARLSRRHRTLVDLERAVLSRQGSGCVVTLSNLDQRLVREYYRVEPERIRVIYNGVDQEVFHPRVRGEREAVRQGLGIPAEATCYIFPAMDFRRKGLAVLLQGLAGLRFPWVLIIAGEDHERPYRRQASRLGISERVRFLGRRSDIQDLYGAADLLVLPTTYDPFGNVHLEALACGLPVVTTAQAGGAEVIRPEATGYVLPDGRDAKALTAVLEDFEGRRSEWPLWQERARESVRGFTQRENARETAECLTGLSARRNRRGNR